MPHVLLLHGSVCMCNSAVEEINFMMAGKSVPHLVNIILKYIYHFWHCWYVLCKYIEMPPGDLVDIDVD